MTWDFGGGYLHQNAEQERAMSWAGKQRRAAGTMYAADAAKALGISRRQLRYLVQQGKLKNHPSPANAGVPVYLEKDVFELAAQRMIARGLKAAR